MSITLVLIYIHIWWYNLKNVTIETLSSGIRATFPVSPVRPYELQIHHGNKKASSQNADNDEEMRTQTHLRLKLDVIIPNRSLPPIPASLVLARLRPLRGLPVKVRHVLAVAKGVAAGTHAAVVGVAVVLAPRVCPLVGGIMPVACVAAALRPRALLVSLPPLLRLITPPATPVEARRRSPKRPSPLAEAACGPASRGTAAVVGAPASRCCCTV